MDEETTQELRIEQLRKEASETLSAESSPDEREAAAHARRAEKARYLRQKLEEQAESERDETPGRGPDG